ncbi:hypothetical protein AB0H43_13655 [Hamadaea sp. NPDC050747]|uniref:hypothetical protein n=1 Tax=Hamadaea sp. NPDC050747 TaxID=3155789 RepID=UPI0033FD823A
MPPEPTIDLAVIRPLLVSLGLADRSQPTLLYARDQATSWRVSPADMDWDRGVAVCLMVLSYLRTWLDDLTDAIGIWLPVYRAVMLVDTEMRCHVLGLDGITPHVPATQRALIAGELRGLMGNALGRPGRGNRLNPPILVTCDLAGAEALMHPHLGGVRLGIVPPVQAKPLWATSVKVFVHHDALDQVCAFEADPRADVTILAETITPQVRVAAGRLRTDAILRWPAAAGELADMLRRHQQMQTLTW